MTPGAVVRRLLVCCTIALTLVPTLPLPAGAATFPNDTGFTDALFADIPVPTSISFASNNRMLVTTQNGTVRIVANGVLQPAPAVSLTVCSSGEQGLLGSAVSGTDVFLYYTSSHNGDCWNRVSKFTLGADNLLTGEVVLLDWIPTPATNHNAGDLNFGPDGKLYVSVGDGGCRLVGTGCAGLNDNARFRTHLLGKILRINTDGTVPADNPFAGTNTRRCGAPTGDTNPGSAAFCSETWAWGLRNPFRFAFRSDGLMHINDVGQGSREEIDVGAAGADYGWNCREGKIANPAIAGGCTLPTATDPIYDYSSATGCRSITGGAFVPDGAWSAAYAGKYLFADFVCGKIFLLDGTTARDFATGLGSSSATHLEFGPDGALYYTTYAGGGEVRRITFAGPGDEAGPPADFDGDGESDVAVFRPSTANWYVNRSTGGTAAVNWGINGDVPAAGDYDGDGREDIAVFRPSTAIWYIQNSSGAPMTVVNWGDNSDVPMPADYDGDGQTDIAVFRPSSANWYVRNSSSGAMTVVNWGINGDIPAVGDFDGDKSDDIAVFRPSTAIWYLRNSSGAPMTVVNWGINGDIPMPGDYDGDEKHDIAVFRPSTANWYLRNSSTGAMTAVNWGANGDIPVAGDYDADGKADVGVFRPSTAVWYLRNSGGAPMTVVNWGLDGDYPIGNPPARS
jgi:glucose/arabinose dehydrogenase